MPRTYPARTGAHTPRSNVRPIAIGLALALMVAACGGSASTTTAPGPTTTAPAPATTAPATTTTAEPTTTTMLPAFPEQTGRGVTVAILDRGIDWRNPDFRNEDGTTRIKWILDMTGNTGCPSQTAPLEYSEAEINDALAGGPPIAHRDASGHGTATAGLAVGNGRALVDGRYRGMAPEADIIVIKIVSEGAPAHGDHAAEPFFNACITEALDWLDAKITELGQPTVAIWNAGTQFGPIDGTSTMSRKIDEVFGLDRPGRVWVAPSGDEGSLPSHAGGDYSQDAPAVVSFTKTTDGVSYPTMWLSGDAPATITIEFADGTVVGPFGGPGVTSIDRDGVGAIVYEVGNDAWGSTGGDRGVWLSITGHRGRGTITITPTTATAGRFDLYGDLSGQSALTSSIEFHDHLVEGRLTDVASTRSAIVVGNHVLRDSYTDIDGRDRDRSEEGFEDALWLKSSGGPTRDGRLGIDLTAAGQGTFASLGTGSYWSTLNHVLPADGEARYVYFGGASASAPIVVGAVALMLEIDPTLTAEEARQILRATAVADEHTGAVPNNDWGYGKLDVFAAVTAVSGEIGQ